MRADDPVLRYCHESPGAAIMLSNLTPDRLAASSTLRRCEVLSALAVAALLIVIVPLFVCMPLGVDTAFYDACAQHILRGGALERDLLFLAPPGMAWAMAAVRLLFGASSEAVRLADLAVLAAIVWLLLRCLHAMELPRLGRLWAAFGLFGFYLTGSEWIHCQPDTWMLLPALLALHLRRRQVSRLATPDVCPSRLAWSGFLEGLVWGAGCLIKPFVVVPGLLVWLVAAALARRSGPGWARRLAWDVVGLLIGGVLMGAVWQGWLLSTGSWQAYWENYVEFRGDYFANATSLTQRLLFMLDRMPPWGLIHLLAVPVSLATLSRIVVSLAQPSGNTTPASTVATCLLASLYLGWVVQGNFLQYQYEYHMAPCVLLAVTVLAGWVGMRLPLPRRSVAFIGLLLFGSLFQPAFAPSRLALWGRCWQEGSSPELRDRLALWDSIPFARTEWQHLEEVKTFLRGRQVADGDLMCYHLSSVPLYPELGLKPSTRFIFASSHTFQFVAHREGIQRELRAGSQRYIVTDLREMAASLQGSSAEPLPAPVVQLTDLLPLAASQYPYTEPVVFQAGCYLVHAVWPTESP